MLFKFVVLMTSKLRSAFRGQHVETATTKAALRTHQLNSLGERRPRPERAPAVPGPRGDWGQSSERRHPRMIELRLRREVLRRRAEFTNL